MKKKYIYGLFISIVMCFSAILLSSCCTPNKCKVTVNFIGASSELGFSNYVDEVEFDSTMNMSLFIPEGFDHSQIKIKVDNKDWEYDVEYLEELDSEEYAYSVGKNVKFEIINIRKNFQIDIDMSTMPRLQFDFKIQSSMTGFKILVVDPNILNRLTTLNTGNIIREVPFQNNVAKLNYGEYVMIAHTGTKGDLDGLYSEVNHFTDSKKIKSLGTTNYSYYAKSVRGNTNYIYNNIYDSSIYFFGKVQEDVNFYSSVPNYEPDKGFEIKRTPNIFYLFTNLSEYNGEMLTIEPYYAIDGIFNSGNFEMDKIGNTTIKKAEPAFTYQDRYDIYQLYLGDNFEIDPLLSAEEKTKTYEQMYIKIYSKYFPVDQINNYLLNYEYEYNADALKLYADNLSTRGYYYIKLTRENLLEYSNLRDMLDSLNNVIEYYSGSAILSVSAKQYLLDVDIPSMNYKFAQIYIYKEIWEADQSFADQKDFHIMVYIKDGSVRKYGFVDYHTETGSSKNRDVVYFLKDDLFDQDGKYKNNLYMEVRAKDYVDFRSLTIDRVDFYEQEKPSPLNGATPILCEDYKTYNGLEYLINLEDNRLQWTYSLKAVINVNNLVGVSQVLDFSSIQLPANLSDGIYLTKNYIFDDRSDFQFVFSQNKDTFNSVNISFTSDVYYFAKVDGDKNYDIELRLDPLDSYTCVSSNDYLCDILGERLSIEVNGEQYFIKVLKLEKFYEANGNNKIFVVKSE